MTSETELLDVLSSGLDTLRQAFRSDRSQFTPADIDFLKSLGEISDHLRAFLDVQRDIPDITAVDQFEERLRTLRRLREGLAGTAVVRRIGAVTRELHQRLPAILEQDKSRQEFREFRAQFRILGLQKVPRLCAFGHPMVLRERTDGLYWGCSRYPDCEATAELSPQESAVAQGRL